MDGEGMLDIEKLDEIITYLKAYEATVNEQAATMLSSANDFVINMEGDDVAIENGTYLLKLIGEIQKAKKQISDVRIKLVAKKERWIEIRNKRGTHNN